MKRHTYRNFTTIVHKNQINSLITMTNNWVFITINKTKHSLLSLRDLTVKKTRELLLGPHVLSHGCQLPCNTAAVLQLQSVGFWLADTHKIVQFTMLFGHGSRSFPLFYSRSFASLSMSARAERNKILIKKLFSVFYDATFKIELKRNRHTKNMQS